MELEKISILIIVIGLCTLGFIGFLNEITRANTNLVIDPSFNATFNKISEESNRINQSQSALFSTGVNSVFNFLPTIQSFFGVMNIMLGSLGVLNQMIMDMSTQMGIPSWVVTGLLAILLVLFIFAIYKATLGRSRV